MQSVPNAHDQMRPTAGIKRSKEGDPKIPGVKMTRLQEMDMGRGFSLVESDDPVAVSKLAVAWSDLVDQRTVAVAGDAEVAAALAGAAKMLQTPSAERSK